MICQSCGKKIFPFIEASSSLYSGGTSTHLASFCSNCGAKLFDKCPVCALAHPVGTEFCVLKGTALAPIRQEQEESDRRKKMEQEESDRQSDRRKEKKALLQRERDEKCDRRLKALVCQERKRKKAWKKIYISLLILAGILEPATIVVVGWVMGWVWWLIIVFCFVGFLSMALLLTIVHYLLIIPERMRAYGDKRAWDDLGKEEEEE